MMRPWRDVLSYQAFLGMMGNETTAHISKGMKLASKFSDKVATPEASLTQIAERLKSYHAIPKTQLSMLGKRRDELQYLSMMASAHMHQFKVDMDFAKQRALKGSKWAATGEDKSTKSPYTGHYESGNPAEESLDRNLLSLQRRALRKRDYLQKLEDYYTTGQGHAFLQNVLAPKVDTNDVVGLHGGVKAEALDFAHRNIEVHIGNGKVVMDDELRENPYGIAHAFADWLNNIGNQTTPFFLWLEKHPICLADDKGLINTTVGVSYINSENNNVPPQFDKLAVITFSNGAMMHFLAKPNGQPQVADTGGYCAASSKGGPGYAAYVWTEARELFINNHSEGSFHHSSFVSGRQVRCAGMIKFEGGRVTGVTNNSGHYRPRAIHLKNFLQFLVSKSVINHNTFIKVAGGGYEGPYGQSQMW